MLKKILLLVWYLVGIFFIVFLKLALTNILPYPFNLIDVTMLFFVLLIMRGAKGGIVWFGFAVYVLLDFSSANFFGIEVLAGVYSILLVYWFFREIFTNLSIWAAAILTAFGLLVYRITYLVIGWIAGALFQTNFLITKQLLKTFGFEIVLTSICVIPLYILTLRILKRFAGERIRYS